MVVYCLLLLSMPLASFSQAGTAPPSPAPEAVRHYAAGLDLLKAGKFRNAGIEFQAATAADSAYGDAFFALGRTFITLNQYEKAVAAYEAARRIGVSRPQTQQSIPAQLADAYRRWGVAAYAERDYRQAIDALERALVHGDGDPTLHYTLGLCYGGLRDTERARAALERAVELDPGYAKAHKALGDLHRRDRALRSAAAAYREAIALDSTYMEAHGGLARVEVDSEDFTAAEEALRRALRIDAEFAYAFLMLGHTMNQLGRFHEAIEPLRRSIDLDGDNWEGHYRLGEAYYGTGDYRKAIEAGQTALRKKRDYPAAQVIVADSYGKLNMLREARTWYLEAARDSRFKDYCNYKLEELENRQP